MPTFRKGEAIKVPLPLPVPSVVRTAKIATIEAADAVRLGRLAAAPLRRVIEHIVRELSGAGD